MLLLFFKNCIKTISIHFILETIQIHFVSLQIHVLLDAYFTVQTNKQTYKNFTFPHSKDKELFQVWTISYKDWFRRLTQFRPLRHQPRAFAGTIRKEVLSFCWSWEACLYNISLCYLENKSNAEESRAKKQKVTESPHHLNT